MEHKILLVEDDFALAMGTEYALQAEGYDVVHVSNLESARNALTQSFDLILLDVMLPDGTGYDLCKEIRQKSIFIPIIFLTAVAEEVNVVQGLELGADDYVAKPYRVKELLSRIAANIRRYQIQHGSRPEMSHQFGEHLFLLEEFRLQCKGEYVDCTPSELRLLKELILHEGQVLTRNQLLERLYDAEENYIDDNTLSVYMKRLRDRLGKDAEWIETVRGVGYRFKKRG
ncbi:MAG: response regulator transcription factor [Lachnospiraceae bacterium]|nr:response regulator transcription factor [Lachnospiraceae bacterium]